MKAKLTLTPANFSATVREWSYGRFMQEFHKIYPVDELQKVAKEMGLKKETRKTK